MGLGSDQIGSYRIGKLLGKGRLSKVKLGRHVASGAHVAIKILDKDAVIEAGAEKEISREVQLLKELNHPNVVNLIEVIASKDKVYLVMEYVSGGDLFAYISKHGALKEDDAKGIFRQLLDGVEACHQNSIFHRDIKAENVLLTAEGNAKLTDFGLGALAPSQMGVQARLTSFVGTTTSAAPEVLARNADYAGAPADVWGLGVLLYFMMTQRTPFRGTEYTDLVAKTSRGLYHEPLYFSRELSSFIKAIFRVDPESRATLEELRQHPWLHSEAGKKQRRVQQPIQSHQKTATVMMPPSPVTMVELSTPPGSPPNAVHKPVRMNAFELMASALDISAILDKQDTPSRTSTRFLSRCSPAVILGELETLATSKAWTPIRLEDSRCRITAGQSSMGPCAAYVDLVDVLPGLVMVKFSRCSGSTAALEKLFQEVIEHPECQKIMLAQYPPVAS